MKSKPPFVPYPELNKLKHPALVLLEEAEYCSTCHYRKSENKNDDNVLGYAAMELCFSVMVTIGEILNTDSLPKKKDKCPHSSDGRAIRRYLLDLHPEKWLLAKPPMDIATIDVGQTLSEIRSGFIHQLSMPNHVILLYDKRKFPVAQENVGIDVAEFVKDVRSGLDEIMNNHGTRPVPNNKGNSKKRLGVRTTGS